MLAKSEATSIAAPHAILEYGSISRGLSAEANNVPESFSDTMAPERSPQGARDCWLPQDSSQDIKQRTSTEIVALKG